MARITVKNLAATHDLGRALANTLLDCPGMRALLLRGPLGSGKTTLARALVESLPGGHLAEVASPSFTLCNHYPTRPPVMHCDLYRSPENLPEELAEGLDNPRILTIVEWSEYLPEADMPQDYLDILLQPCEEERLLTLQAHGPCAGDMLRYLCRRWPAENA